MKQICGKILVAVAAALLAVTSLTAAERKTVIPVYGLDCQSCANGLAGSLKSLKGVKAAEVSLKPGQATVTYDDRQIDLAGIKQQIEMNGFSTSPRKSGGK